jgi:hypothetical protein
LGALSGPSLSRSTRHAAHDGAKEALPAIVPRGIASNDFASDAAIGDGNAWRESNREG